MTVGIAGCGLIGGSIGLAMRAAGHRVIGFDNSKSNLEVARSRGCVDEIGSLGDAVESEICFISVPPDKVIEVTSKAVALKKSETVITDCTSVKGEIAAWLDINPCPTFVPGHPMSGHEKSGPKFSSAWMFRNAKWIVCPHKSTAKSSVQLVIHAVREMGAVPVKMKAREHDRDIAVLSHLPHILAAVLVEMGDALDSVEAGAGSWNDLTRVGGVDPVLWSQIFYSNRVEVLSAISDFKEKLNSIEKHLQANDQSALREFLQVVQRHKRRMN